MRIKWNNIIGLLLVVFLIYLFFHAEPLLERFFEDIDDHQLWPDEPIWQFNMLGLLCLTIVALVRVLK